MSREPVLVCAHCEQEITAFPCAPWSAGPVCSACVQKALGLLFGQRRLTARDRFDQVRCRMLGAFTALCDASPDEASREIEGVTNAMFQLAYMGPDDGACVRYQTRARNEAGPSGAANTDSVPDHTAVGGDDDG